MKPSPVRQKVLRREIEFVRIRRSIRFRAGNRGEFGRAREPAGAGAPAMGALARDIARMVTILKVLRHLVARLRHATAKCEVL